MDQAAGRNGVYHSVPLYVATPAVLHLLGINPATIGPATSILTTRAGQAVLTTITNAANVQRIHVPDYRSEPTSLITVNGLRHERWTDRSRRAGDGGGPDPRRSSR